MFDLLIAYVVSLGVFLLIDLLWIGVIARNFYRRTIGNLLADKIKIAPTVIFYTFYVAILCYLVVYPNVQNNNLIGAAVGGALFGIVGYGTYDITNYALLKNWPLSVTIIDLIWGAFVSSTTAIIAFLIAI